MGLPWLPSPISISFLSNQSLWIFAYFVKILLSCWKLRGIRCVFNWTTRILSKIIYFWTGIYSATFCITSFRIALKYSSEDSKVVLSVCNLNEGLEISVVDNGIGIPEADHGNLLNPFSVVPMFWVFQERV